MKNIFALILIISNISVLAQNKYRVETDYLQDRTIYLKLDKFDRVVDTLDKPRFKKNSAIQVKVKNVNPFAVNVEPSLKGIPTHKNEQGFNFANLLGGTSTFAGKKLALNIEDFSATSKIFGTASKDTSTKTSGTAGTRGSRAANRISDFNKLSTEVSAIREALKADLSNPNLSKEKIKENLLKLASLPEDHRLTSPYENFYLYASNFERIFLTDKQAIASEVSVLAMEIDSLTAGSRGDGSEAVILRDLKNLLAGLDESATISVDNLQKIKTLYNLLESSVFERNFDYILDSDQADLELKFSPSSLLGEPSGTVLNSSKKIKLSSTGGFKINTGVAFTLHKTNSRNFYIDDNRTVRGEEYDEFVPGLGTMLNFYPILGNNFNVGGTFGVSIPLRSEIKGVNFLFGPSIVLGNENRVVISGGVAYAPVNKLTRGVEIGKTTGLTSLDNFITTIYKPGVYFSVSFNIMKFN